MTSSGVLECLSSVPLCNDHGRCIVVLNVAVVVEEAAEVLECHVVACLSEHCKHLVLIGESTYFDRNCDVTVNRDDTG